MAVSLLGHSPQPAALEWNNRGGSDQAERFSKYIVDSVLKGDVDAAIHYQDHENAAYSVPTPDHYMPLLYCLGAAGDDPATVFNNTCTMGSLSMAGFIWA